MKSVGFVPANVMPVTERFWPASVDVFATTNACEIVDVVALSARTEPNACIVIGVGSVVPSASTQLRPPSVERAVTR